MTKIEEAANTYMEGDFGGPRGSFIKGAQWAINEARKWLKIQQLSNMKELLDNFRKTMGE